MAPKTGDSTQEPEKSFEARFVADVHLIQVLGEQLIASEKVGILELIKNAYDAGATQCDVWIEKVPGMGEAAPSDSEVAELPGPVITIIDNGSGMDRTTIEDGWLRPATRIKTSVKERLKLEWEKAAERGTLDEYERLVAALKTQYGGRLPIGEKGVGRFAAHRLGQYLILQTKVKDEPYEWVLEIDWNKFVPPDDKPHNLQDVPVEIVRREPQRDYGPTNSGTMIRIYGERPEYKWTQQTLTEIGKAITLLRRPDKKDALSAFRVAFYCPQLSEKEFEPPTAVVPPHFECIAIVDEEGKAEIEIRLNPPPSLAKPLPAQKWVETIDLRTAPPEDDLKYWQVDLKDTSLRLPECGSFTLEVKYWYRRGWAPGPDQRQLNKHLDEFGGIGVYRDGLSLLPAQLASRNDWLRLTTRHIKKGERISYYQMIGSVDLVQEHTLKLVERTSREWILDTRAFRDLTELVRAILVPHLEFRVQETRERYSKLMAGDRVPMAELSKRTRVASQVIERVISGYDFETDEMGLLEITGKEDDPKRVLKLAAEAPKELRQEVRTLADQSDALLEAAGYGIAISVAVHEIEKTTSNLYFGLDRLSKEIGVLHTAYEQSQELFHISGALLNELKRLVPLRATRLEQKREFGIRDSILTATGAFRLSWEDLNIIFVLLPKEADFEMFGRFAACSQVFANLFDNATYWLRGVEAGNRRIIAQIEPNERRVVIADSGPGTAEKIRPHLFELFYSLKNPPSGLGLYICRYYMQQMGGRIRESSESERLPGFPGAHFTLTFPEPTREGE